MATAHLGRRRQGTNRTFRVVVGEARRLTARPSIRTGAGTGELGRVGEMDQRAPELTREYRKLAAAGIDPRQPKKAATTLYADVVE